VDKVKGMVPGYSAVEDIVKAEREGQIDVTPFG
jgi:hypothetical protein